MRPLLVLLFLCLSTLAQAQPFADREFDARGLDLSEKRVLQAALALSGDYVGLLDGAWGNGSQSALEAYTMRTAGTGKPRNRHLERLLSTFEAERQDNGWQIIHLEADDLSFAFPLNLLLETDDPETATYASADGSFRLTIATLDLPQMLDAHDAVAAGAAPGFDLYQSYQPDRQITSATLRQGRLAYIRTDRIGESGFVALTMTAAPVHRGRMALLAASIQRGQGTELALPTDGLLAMMAAQTVQPQVTMPPQTSPRDPDRSANDAATSTGTGFYVNNTDIVTAAHVVAGCARMALANGGPLSVLAQDGDLDIAVLSAPRSPVWLSLGTETSARLGEPVMALGFPFLDLLDQGLSVTGGNVSALPGDGDSAHEIMISAPVQPGNSGGPVLNHNGAVIGMVVSRLDDMVVLDETGSLPQNMNFAVSPATLTAFLDRNRIVYPVAPGRLFDLAGGIPDDVARAVVAIYCFGD